MALSNPLLQAVRRYGPSVQGIAHQYGISGEALLAKLIQGESGGSATATSKAGAKGYTQFMPGTRRISIDRYGIDPLAGPDAAVHAAALHLRGKLTGAKGLQGYNPGGGQGYVDYILGQHVGDVGGRSGGGSSNGDSGGLASALSGSVTPGQVTGSGFDPGSPSVSSLADLLGSSRPQPVAPQLPAAPFSSSKYLHMGQSPVVAQSQPEASGSGIDSLLAAVQGSGQEIPQTSVSAAQTSVSGSAPTAHASSAGSVSGHRSPLLELFYNGPGGINAKNGQREPRGFVSGHTDHVHVAAGPKTVVKLGQLAQDMGLHVGENPHYGGVHPVHVKGSYHYRGQAVDVSGTPQQMRAFDRKVASLYGLAGR